MVAVSWIMSFLVCGTALAIFFKPMLDEFGWKRETLSLITAVVFLVFAGLSPFIGRLIDRFGAKVMLLVSNLAMVLCSLVSGLASGIATVYIGRILYELKPIHATQVLVNHWFVKKRGIALGVLSTGIPLGTLILSPVSQYLVLIWGWRMTFFFWAGVTAVVVLPLLSFIRNKPGGMNLSPDGISTAKSETSSSQSPDQAAILKPSAGFNLIQAIQQPSFWLVSGTQIICGIGCGLIGTHIVIFATDLGYSPLIGASFLSVQGGVSLLGVLVTGHLSDRMSRSKVLAMTHFIRCLSFFTMVSAILFSGGSLWVLYPAMVLFGFGWFTTAPLVGGLVADLFGNLRMGTLLGIVLACHMVGTAIGSYAGGLSFQLTHSYFSIFLIQGILEFLAAVFAFMIAKQARRI